MKTCPTCQETYPDDFWLCPHDGAQLADQSTETEAQLAAGLSRRFRLVRPLGKGGMGTVFLAEQMGVGNRPVGLKVLNRKLLDEPDFLLRFQNEEGSTGRIRPANVVTLYRSARAVDGTPYIAMEFLEGESLREVLQRRGALPVPEVAEILLQTARGLNAAHKLGIIHRDLKPDNIFLTRGDESEMFVKVVDFGIAKPRESATPTQTGMLLGTPAYMSYEQASGMRSDEMDARSDIYSLGVVVYEMLTGRVPFHSHTPLGYLRQHMLEAPPPIHAIAPSLTIPPPVEAVVMKALSKDRDHRFASALEFAHEFTRAASAPAPSDDLPPTKSVVLDEAHARQERQVGKRAEADRREKEETEAECLAREKAEQERQDWERAERERLVGEHAEAKRRAEGKAEVSVRGPNRAKYVVFGLVALAVTAGAIWCILPSGTKQETQQTQQLTTAKGPEKTPEPLIPEPGPVAGTVWVNPKDGLKYVWIPPGTFMMGCSLGDSECDKDEKPSHQVTITQGFRMGQTDVTIGAYKHFAESSGKPMPVSPPFNSDWAYEDMPIVWVTWDDAQAYCSWAGGRLPTEAEWEYAARGGSTEDRYGNLDDIAWYIGNSGKQTHEVGQKRANGFGLYDMLGNVWEWVSDWYDEHYYQSSPPQDPRGPAGGDSRVLRGGSRSYGPSIVRVSDRYLFLPGLRSPDGGFRCAGKVGNP